MVALSTAFGLAKGLSIQTAVFILAAFNLTNGVGRLISGLVSDLIGRNTTMALAFLAAAIAELVFAHTTSLALWMVLSAVIGFAFGTLFAVSAPLAVDCFGIQHFGAIFGLVFTAYGFVSGAIGPSLAGYILDVTEGNFVIVFTYLGVFCMLSGFFIRFVVPPEIT